ncbi:hypothetical protein ACSBR1_005885 [Camellia fascicularis]
MLFDSIDDLVQFYQRYAKEKGFGMCIRSSKKVGGEVRYMTVACTHSGKPKIKSSKLHQLHPQSKTDRKAKICANLLGDGKWILRSMVLDHNHGVSPGKARFYRCHKALNSAVKRRLELHAKAGEDTETFTWLFQSWLTCISGCPPSAIIMDQDQAMKNAIEVVFPNARHRWCLWHIMKKLLEKLRGYNQYEGIKFSMKNVVYDSLTIGEFEESWGKFIEKYKLQSNK